MRKKDGMDKKDEMYKKDGMGKKRKEARGYLHFIVILLCSGLVGGCVGLFMGGAIRNDAISRLFSRLPVWMNGNYRVLMCVICACFFVANFWLFWRMRALIRRIHSEEDEEKIDVLEMRMDPLYSVISAVGMVFYVVVFGLFVFRMQFVLEDPHAPATAGMLFDVGIFLLFGIGYGVLNIRSVNLYKKYDTRKRGIPGTKHFQEEWLRSSDEAERMEIYKVGYKTGSAATKILIYGFGAAALCSLFFKGALWSVVITGGMLIAYTIANTVITHKNAGKPSKLG